MNRAHKGSKCNKLPAGLIFVLQVFIFKGGFKMSITTPSKSKAALLSVFSNTFLIIIKIIAAILSGSVSILSEAIHSGIDLIASSIALFSVIFSSKPPDKEHPYGHGKIENVSGTAEGILIFIAAFLILITAISKIANPQPLEETNIAIAIMFFSSLLNLFVSKVLKNTAKKENSIALEADSLHLKTDVYTSMGVGFGILLIKLTGIYMLDPLIAIIVSFLIIKEAYILCRKAFSPLLDTKLPEEEENTIIKILEKYKDHIHGYHKLKTRQCGNQRYAEVHLVLDPDLSIQEYQQIYIQITKDLNECLDNIEITFHVEPFSNDPNLLK